MATDYFTDRGEPEEFDEDLYVPSPEDLTTCSVCATTYDMSILGEAVKHMHDPSLPLHPILYLVRGSRRPLAGRESARSLDKESFRQRLIQFMIGLARKYEMDDEEEATIKVIMNSGEIKPVTMCRADDGRYLLAFANDNADAGAFRLADGKWQYSGTLAAAERAQVLQYVLNMSVER